MQGIIEYHTDGRILVGAVPKVMGTRLTGLITGSGENPARSAWTRAVELASRLDAMLDRFSPFSEVSLMNAGCDSGPREVSAELVHLLTECREYRIRTSGIFDIAEGGGSYSIQHRQVDLHGTNIDFGGIAKGWFLRQCRDIFRESGITDAFVSFGSSSILAMGHHPHGDCWKVSVTDPYTGDAVTERDLRDSSLSVSGNRPGYEGHIIDPRTGMRIYGRRITVAESPDPADAEVLSTTAVIASPEELSPICEHFEDMTIHTYND